MISSNDKSNRFKWGGEAEKHFDRLAGAAGLHSIDTSEKEGFPDRWLADSTSGIWVDVKCQFQERLAISCFSWEMTRVNGMYFVFRLNQIDEIIWPKCFGLAQDVCLDCPPWSDVNKYGHMWRRGAHGRTPYQFVTGGLYKYEVDENVASVFSRMKDRKLKNAAGENKFRELSAYRRPNFGVKF